MPTPEATRAEVRVCVVEGCDRGVKARGLCNAHYKRMRRHGDPERGRVAVGVPLRFLNEVALRFDGEECLTWPFTRNPKTGYPVVYHNGKHAGAHRVVCELAHGAPPSPRHEAAHSCGKGHEGCVNPRHLRWATSKENKADKVAHGTNLRGERHPRALLTNAQVHEIRELRGVVPGRELAERYGVSAPTITGIQKRNSWAWL